MRRRRLLILFIGLVIAIAWYIHRIPLKPQQFRYPDEALETVEIEMWPDAISESEDIIRLRFHYKNISKKVIESFSATFGLWNWTGDGLLFDEMTITDILHPDETSSWSTRYRHRDFPAITRETWQLLCQRDIRSLATQWRLQTLTFMDGQILRTESGLPFTDPGYPDSTTLLKFLDQTMDSIPRSKHERRDQ